MGYLEQFGRWIWKHRFLLFMCAFLISLGFTSLHFAGLDYFDFDNHADNLFEIIINTKSDETGDSFKSKARGAIAYTLELMHDKSYLKSFFLHFSIACFLAVLLILVVETHIRTNFQKELGENVLLAVLRQQIPKRIYTELHDHVLRTSIIREKWNYHIEFREKPYPYDLPDEFIIMEVTASWMVKNISSVRQTYKPQSSIVNHPSYDIQLEDKKIHLSKHLYVHMDGEPLLTEQEIVEQEQKQIESDEIVLDINEFTLKPNEEKLIKIKKEELGYNRDVAIYSMAGCGVGLTVSIENRISDIIKVYPPMFYHPKKDELREEAPNRWEYKGGLLPNQGFRLSWTPIV